MGQKTKTMKPPTQQDIADRDRLIALMRDQLTAALTEIVRMKTELDNKSGLDVSHNVP